MNPETARRESVDRKPGATLIHLACHCTRPGMVAFCGYVGTETAPAGLMPGPRCVVCEDLSRQPCPRCGWSAW